MEIQSSPHDVLIYIKQFVDENNYLNFCTSCSQFNGAWGADNKVTMVNRDTTPEILCEYIRCGIPQNEKVCMDIVKYGARDIFRKACFSIGEEDCEEKFRFATSALYELLEIAIKAGYPIGEELCYFAAKRGDLDLLKWARKNGAEWDERTWNEAVLTRDMEWVKYLTDEEAPWDDDEHMVIQNAASIGWIEFLEYAIENCLEMEHNVEAISLGAAKEGDEDMMEWLTEIDSSWKQDGVLVQEMVKHATAGGHDDFLGYIYTRLHG